MYPDKATTIGMNDRGLPRCSSNDIDPAVYCFWVSVVGQSEQFAARIVDTPLNVEEWRRQKAIYRAADESDPLALAEPVARAHLAAVNLPPPAYLITAA
jgi:hypothetical protein